ncbi:hypothetical protein GCM10027203_35500 [Nonomuraea fastidiosa]
MAGQRKHDTCARFSPPAKHVHATYVPTPLTAPSARCDSKGEPKDQKPERRILSSVRLARLQSHRERPTTPSPQDRPTTPSPQDRPTTRSPRDRLSTWSPLEPPSSRHNLPAVHRAETIEPREAVSAFAGFLRGWAVAITLFAKPPAP